MDGTNFWTILKALKDEDMTDEAAVVEQIMENRTLRGVENVCRFYAPPGVPVPGPGDPGDRGPAYPGCHWYLAENRTLPWANQTGLPGAGSEFAWDTTGQEESFVWGAYFGSLPSLPSGDRTAAAALARSALDQILAYTPLVPNWAWHGSSYGMGDFGNNGYVELDGGDCSDSCSDSPQWPLGASDGLPDGDLIVGTSSSTGGLSAFCNTTAVGSTPSRAPRLS